MNITSKTKYALEIILMAMRTNGRVKTQDAALALGVAVDYPQQLVFKLKKSGILTVKKGAKIGGAYANEKTFNTTLGEVMDAVESERLHKPKQSTEVNLLLSRVNNSIRDIKVTDLLIQ